MKTIIVPDSDDGAGLDLVREANLIEAALVRHDDPYSSETIASQLCKRAFKMLDKANPNLYDWCYEKFGRIITDGDVVPFRRELGASVETLPLPQSGMFLEIGKRMSFTDGSALVTRSLYRGRLVCIHFGEGVNHGRLDDTAVRTAAVEEGVPARFLIKMERPSWAKPKKIRNS